MPADRGPTFVHGARNPFLDPSLTWEALSWLVAESALPVVVKGVLRADDARRAVERGAAAIAVSNHGGRNLDTVPATIDDSDMDHWNFPVGTRVWKTFAFANKVVETRSLSNAVGTFSRMVHITSSARSVYSHAA